jgi:hypothetical protein
MSSQNLSVAKWIKAQSTNLAARGQVTTSQAVLHSVIVNSNTGGSFRVANGTLTSLSQVMGTYTPTTATSGVVDFKELEFTNGIFLETGGSVNLTLIYNDLV